MQSEGTYLQSYNSQLTLESKHQLIVAVDVSNQLPVVEHLEPMLERIAASADALPTVMILDAGYWSEVNANAYADQGIDVVCDEAVAQVKAHMVPIGRPDLQNLAGVAAVEGKTALFFALNGFTAQAIEWADKAKMALFTFDLQGEPEPVNQIASQYTTE